MQHAASTARAREAEFVGPPSLIRRRTNHTRFVGAMKLVLPLVAGLLIAMVLIWPQMGDQPQVLGLLSSPAGIQDNGRGQMVVNASFRGVDSRDQPYVITAEQARQSNGNPEQVELTNPKADVTLRSGAWLGAAAPKGLFLRKAAKLLLHGGISLFHIDGYEFRTESATIDLQKGTARGTDRIKGQGPAGTLTARGFKVLKQGDRILFTGRSRLVLYGRADRAAR